MRWEWMLQRKKMNPGIKSHLKFRLFSAGNHDSVIFTGRVSNGPECLLQILAGGRPVGSHLLRCERNQKKHAGLVIHDLIPASPVDHISQPTAEFLAQDTEIFAEYRKPRCPIRLTAALMLQPGNRERTCIGIWIKEERLAPAKMTHTWTANLFREMPATADTVFYEFFFAVMPPDMLQIGHRNCDFTTLRHRVDKVIECSHFTPGKQPWRLLRPRFSSIPYIKGYGIPPASKGSRTEVGVPPPFKVRVERAQLYRIKVKMWQPGWDFCGVGWG